MIMAVLSDLVLILAFLGHFVNGLCRKFALFLLKRLLNFSNSFNFFGFFGFFLFGGLNSTKINTNERKNFSFPPKASVLQMRYAAYRFRKWLQL